MLPVLNDWYYAHDGSQMAIPELAAAVQWAEEFEERHGLFTAFLSRYERFVDTDFETDEGLASPTPAGQSHNASFRRGTALQEQSAALADVRFVETRGWMIITKIYMRHLRQQLSRELRQGDEVLQWMTEEGYESAFTVFAHDELEGAARALLVAMCPGDGVAWDPPPPTDEGAEEFAGTEYFDHVQYAVLFLAVQQFAENLRQSAAFKKRAWQYLGAALPGACVPGARWDLEPASVEWAEFRTRCRHVCQLQKVCTWTDWGPAEVCLT